MFNEKQNLEIFNLSEYKSYYLFSSLYYFFYLNQY